MRQGRERARELGREWVRMKRGREKVEEREREQGREREREQGRERERVQGALSQQMQVCVR
jgi:hypothetical protein